MNKSWMLIILGALLVADSLVISARAQSNVVYAAEYNQPTNHFGTINLLNGNFAKLASIGSAKINDIAYCPTNATLYGISNSAVLVTFNKTNGAITKIANLSTNGIESLGFRPSDGKLFGAAQSRLYTINPVNGTATSVGNYGSPRNLNSAGQNIRFAQDGNLYVSNTGTNTDIYRINTTNGAATWMGEAVGYPYLMLQNGGQYMYGVFVNLGNVSNTYPELVSFDLSSFVNGGTNANGSTHQITLTLVGAGTNFPANVVFSGNVPQPVTNLTVAVSATGLSNQTAVAGGNVVFSTTTSGTGPYNYVWSKNGAAISGQTNSSLMLNNVTTNDTATYSVIVGGAIGTVTNSATLTVNQAAASIVLGSLNQTYSGSAKAATATTTPSGLAVTFTYNGSATAPANAGSYTVVGTINDPNYQGSATGTLVIAQASGSIVLGSLSQTYNGSAKAATATTTPIGLAVTFTYNGSATAPANAGSYAVVGTINGPNYQGSAAGTLVINPAALTITAAANTRTYDGTTNAAAVPTVVGLRGFDSVVNLAETYDTRNVGMGKALSVSAYTVNDGNAGANYTVNTVASSAGAINPALLTVTANDKCKMCGQPNPALTASYSGFISGEDTNVLTSPAILNTTATINSAAGAYPITASGAAAANYAVNYDNGTLTVTVAPVVQLSCASVNVSGTSQFVVSWSTTTNQTYQLEYTTNLAAQAWTTVGGLLSGTGATLAVTNSMSGTPQGFFRLELQ